MNMNSIEDPNFVFGSNMTEWSWMDTKNFENALLEFPEELPDRWQKIAGRLPGKSVQDIVAHYEKLLLDIANIEAGLIQLPNYSDLTETRPIIQVPHYSESMVTRPSIQVANYSELTENRPSIQVLNYSELTGTRPSIQVANYPEFTETRPSIQVPNYFELMETRPSIQVSNYSELTETRPSVQVPNYSELTETRLSVQVPNYSELTEIRPSIQVPNYSELTETRPSIQVPNYSEFMETRSSGSHDFNGNRSQCERKKECDRKKGRPWTVEEHRLFLYGLKIYGKSDWRSISRNVVKTRLPSQVASHAQKFFNRQKSGTKERKRSSIHDITIVSDLDIQAYLSTTSQAHPSTEESSDDSALAYLDFPETPDSVSDH